MVVEDLEVKEVIFSYHLDQERSSQVSLQLSEIEFQGDNDSVL